MSDEENHSELIFANLLAGRLSDTQYNLHVLSYQEGKKEVVKNIYGWLEYSYLDDKDLERLQTEFQVEIPVCKELFFRYVKQNELQKASKVLLQLNEPMEELLRHISFSIDDESTEMMDWLISLGLTKYQYSNCYLEVVSRMTIANIYKYINLAHGGKTFNSANLAYREVLRREDFTEEQKLELFQFFRSSGISLADSQIEMFVWRQGPRLIDWFFLHCPPKFFDGVYGSILGCSKLSEDEKLVLVKRCHSHGYKVGHDLQWMLARKDIDDVTRLRYLEIMREVGAVGTDKDFEEACNYGNFASMKWLHETYQLPYGEPTKCWKAVLLGPSFYMVEAHRPTFEQVKEMIDWMVERLPFNVATSRSFTYPGDYLFHIWNEDKNKFTSTVYDYFQTLHPEIYVPPVVKIPVKKQSYYYNDYHYDDYDYDYNDVY